MNHSVMDSKAKIHASVWTESFQVRTFETDITGHLSIFNLCNYLQEVAGNHARALGVSIEKLQEEQMTWMLSRFHLQVSRYPTWKEKVRIETWPSGQSGIHATREFLVYTEDGEQVAKGTSAWLMIDLKRYRPVRMPAFIEAIVLPDLPRPIEDKFNKLHGPSEGEVGVSFKIGYHDLDINQHANSMRYINWALEAVPYETRTNGFLQGLEAQFRAEAKYGTEVESRMEEEGNTIRHGVYASDSGKELAVVRSTWREER